MLKLSKLLSTCLMVFLLAGSIDAYAVEPGTTFRVINVSKNDPVGLNVREIIGDVLVLSDASIVGQLVWNAQGIIATGLEYQFLGALWRQIRLGNKTGWVNSKFLLAEGSANQISTLPKKFKCLGTEPFWGFSIHKNSAFYQGTDWDNDNWLENEKMHLLARHRLINRTKGTWVITMTRASAPQYIRALINVAPHMCSDGMSDFSYPYEAVFLQGKIPVPQQGCCHVDVGK